MFTTKYRQIILGNKSGADPEGGERRSGPPTLVNYKNIGSLSNTGPDPLKITKLPIQHSMMDHHRPASETLFKLRFAGGPLMSRKKWYLDHSSPHQIKEQNKKKPVKVGPPLTKLSGSAHSSNISYL